MQEAMLHINVPDGKEKDELIRRISSAKTKEEAFEVAQKAKQFWGERDANSI